MSPLYISDQFTQLSARNLHPHNLHFNESIYIEKFPRDYIILAFPEITPLALTRAARSSRYHSRRSSVVSTHMQRETFSPAPRFPGAVVVVAAAAPGCIRE